MIGVVGQPPLESYGEKQLVDLRTYPVAANRTMARATSGERVLGVPERM